MVLDPCAAIASHFPGGEVTAAHVRFHLPDPYGFPADPRGNERLYDELRAEFVRAGILADDAPTFAAPLEDADERPKRGRR